MKRRILAWLQKDEAEMLADALIVLGGFGLAAVLAATAILSIEAFR